eukprot:CAMPEP_0172482118 /NCGR_PEP_ID=MMETSP1066-20121228/8381_1 /TAXON_ID=671091 /ORGANISM="Coscinodiscus wailesii, Strain CCMP2513" /LENGTH=469 /DNA_ID=CAMNT_0013245011 /DNA_START=157 /DNA_END=1566 /DNA_ORIENTATION=-
MVIHKQALDEYEYLRSIVEELNNVAVDLYREGDFKTAIDLYKDATQAIMLAFEIEGNDIEVIDDDSREKFISQIVRGKQQLYEMAKPSRSSDSNLDSYQWSVSGVNSSPIYLWNALKIENDNEQGHDYTGVNVVIIMYNTGLIHMKNGDLEIAEEFFDLAMEFFELAEENGRLNDRNYSFLNSLVLADLFNNIGYLRYREGNIADAIENFSHALNISEKVLMRTNSRYEVDMMQGCHHVGTIYYNIGIANARLGSTDKAMRMFQCCLYYHKIALGESHPDMGIVQYSIGMVLVGIGKLDDAMNAFLESLQINRFVFGNYHVEVGKTLYSIGKVHEMKDEYDEALNVYEETLRVERLTLGVHHPETIMTMYGIGQIYHKKGDHRKVLRVYHDIISLAKATSDIEGSSLVLVLGEIVMIYLEVGNIDAATKIYSEVANMIELENGNIRVAGIVGLEQIKDMLMNPPAAPAA